MYQNFKRQNMSGITKWPKLQNVHSYNALYHVKDAALVPLVFPSRSANCKGIILCNLFDQIKVKRIKILRTCCYFEHFRHLLSWMLPGLVSDIPGWIYRISGLISRISGWISRISGWISRISRLISRISGLISRISGVIPRMSGFISGIEFKLTVRVFSSYWILGLCWNRFSFLVNCWNLKPIEMPWLQVLYSTLGCSSIHLNQMHK